MGDRLWVMGRAKKVQAGQAVPMTHHLLPITYYPSLRILRDGCEAGGFGESQGYVHVLEGLARGAFYEVVYCGDDYDPTVVEDLEAHIAIVGKTHVAGIGIDVFIHDPDKLIALVSVTKQGQDIGRLRPL